MLTIENLRNGVPNKLIVNDLEWKLGPEGYDYFEYYFCYFHNKQMIEILINREFDEEEGVYYIGNREDGYDTFVSATLKDLKDKKFIEAAFTIIMNKLIEKYPYLIEE